MGRVHWQQGGTRGGYLCSDEELASVLPTTVKPQALAMRMLSSSVRQPRYVDGSAQILAGVRIPGRVAFFEESYSRGGPASIYSRRLMRQPRSISPIGCEPGIGDDLLICSWTKGGRLRRAARVSGQ